MAPSTRIIFFLLDTLLLNLSMMAAFYFFDSNTWYDYRVELIYLLIYSNISWLFLILVSSPYSLTKGWSVTNILKHQAAFLFIHLLIIFSLVLFFQRQYQIFPVVSFYLVFAIVFFAYRVGYYYFRKFFIPDLPYKGFVLVGKAEHARELRRYYLRNPELNYRFITHLEVDGYEFPLKEIEALCNKKEVHEIICCFPEVDEAVLRRWIQFGLDSLIKVKIMFSAEDQSRSIEWEQEGKLPGINLTVVAIDEPVNQLLKRVFDFVFTTIIFLLVLSWLLPLVAVLIKGTSRGPVFFIQQRNGEGNKPFGCIKFRTMTVNQEADTKQATKDDARITSIGKFLRKSSIDELPQFINVLKGEMSLIGPRPHPIKLNEKFAPLISSLMSRHYVKPGITGLAQCMGYRGETQTLADMENRVRLDRYYIENWSFWLDIKIIFLTIVSLIRGSDKAY